MTKKITMVFALVYAVNSLAQNQNIIDIFGEDQQKAGKIIQQYAKKINLLVDKAVVCLKTNKELSPALKLSKKRLLDQLKQEQHYLYANFDIIYYPDIKGTYTTIEVVRNDQPDRLKYVNGHKVNIKQTHTHQSKPDLIDQMIDYKVLSLQLIVQNKISAQMPKDCPVYHCIAGFEHPQLKPYLSMFNQGVLAQKQWVIDTLKHDSDDNRRAAAVYLLGHLTNPQEIVSLLLPFVNDPNPGLRNEVMRVIGTTIQKANIKVNLMPFLGLLNSPVTTDRNKALMILFTQVRSKQANNQIIHCGDKLIDILRLKQPDNHDFAYFILKRISGKNYGEYDSDAWQKWLTAAQLRIHTDRKYCNLMA